MDKVAMRDWVSALEEMIDNKLKKWKKQNVVQDKELASLEWQFEQTHMIVNVSWPDGREVVSLHCVGPVVCHRYLFYGLDDKTFNKLCDRVGNLAQITMYPPIDPLDQMDERREDWRHGVDQNLASLNAGQRVWERELEAIHESLSEIYGLLHGKETSGLVGKIEELDNKITRLYAVIFQDSTGKHGLIREVQELKEGREDRRTIWGDVTKIVVAVLMSGLALHLWPSIKAVLNRDITDPVDQAIERAKHPKDRYHRYKAPKPIPEETAE